MTTSWPYPTGLEGLAFPQFVPPPGEYSQGFLEVLDYENDWGDWLPTGDAIVSSTWTAETGLHVLDGGHTGTTTTVWVSGGDEGHCYWAMNLVATSGGRTGQRTLRFKIKGHPYHRHACLVGHGGLAATT